MLPGKLSLEGTQKADGEPNAKERRGRGQDGFDVTSVEAPRWPSAAVMNKISEFGFTSAPQRSV